MKTVVLCSSILVLLIAAMACNGLFRVKDLKLTEVVWQLESFQERGGKITGVGSEDIMLVFTEDSLKGQAFPKEGPRTHGNSYGGLYETSATGALSIDLKFSTEMGTLPGSRYEEYLQALRDAFRYDIEGNRLRIYYDGKVLNFKARQDGSYPAMQWIQGLSVLIRWSWTAPEGVARLQPPTAHRALTV